MDKSHLLYDCYESMLRQEVFNYHLLEDDQQLAISIFCKYPQKFCVLCYRGKWCCPLGPRVGPGGLVSC